MRGEERSSEIRAHTAGYFNPDLETMSRDHLRAYQWTKIQDLLKLAFSQNEFYRKKWQAAGVRDWQDVDSLEDFLQLPLTLRDELSADQVEHPPYGTNLSWPLDEFTHFHRTSGSSGEPLIVLSTLEDWAAQSRTWCYHFASLGLKPGDSIYISFSFGPFAGLWNAVGGAEMAGIMMMPGGGQRTLQRLHFIMKYRPSAVISIPSYALRMAETAAEEGIDLTESGVRLLIHGGEPGASIPATRARIEQGWGAKAYDATGASEIGHHGFECPEQQGVHLIESEFFIEILAPDSAVPVSEGDVGEMVVTSLSKTGMMAVRYRTGDLVRLTHQPCECGRTFSRLQGGILSRIDGMIPVRGINIYPTAIENCLMSYPEVAEFHVNISDRAGMKELVIQIEPPKPMEASRAKDFMKTISDDLTNRLSLRAGVEIVEPGSLPRSIGKAQRFSYKS